VKLGITAPESILVLREELCDADDDKHTTARIDEIARLRGSLQERRQRKAQ
jgi:sRNA-binding carbon storage regulator CsrA